MRVPLPSLPLFTPPTLTLTLSGSLVVEKFRRRRCSLVHNRRVYVRNDKKKKKGVYYNNVHGPEGSVTVKTGILQYLDRGQAYERAIITPPSRIPGVLFVLGVSIGASCSGRAEKTRGGKKQSHRTTASREKRRRIRSNAVFFNSEPSKIRTFTREFPI